MLNLDTLAYVIIGIAALALIAVFVNAVLDDPMFWLFMLGLCAVAAAVAWAFSRVVG